MGVKLLHILSRPYNIRDRNAPPRTDVKIQNFFQQDDGFVVKFMVNSQSNPNKSYLCDIWLDDKKFINSTNAKFFCTCPSFQYQFETILAQHNGLLGSPRSHKLPKKERTLSVCKHLESSVYKLLSYKSLIPLIKEYKIEL